MFTKILTFIKPTENFRITSVHSKNIATQIGNIFYAITEDNPSYSLKFTVIKSTDRVVNSFDEPINDKRFLKIVTPPCAILTTISIISLFLIKKVAIIQLIPFIPMVFIIYGYIIIWVDDLPKIKLPKFNIKKLLSRE